MEKIRLVYIDNDPEEAISAYLEQEYRNDNYEIEYQELSFNCQEGYEGLLQSPIVTSANVILIDSFLFDNDLRSEGKFSGEEFRIILRKIYPFIEVLVITQNGENKEYGIIPKYRGQMGRNASDYYRETLKAAIDESIERITIFRNISQKLQNNAGIDKLLVDRVEQSLNGVTENYDALKKADIDNLIKIFQSLE